MKLLLVDEDAACLTIAHLAIMKDCFVNVWAGREEVLASVAAHKAAGIHSIPVAIIRSGAYNTTVHGSASPEEFLRVFQEIEAHWMAADDSGQ